MISSALILGVLGGLAIMYLVIGVVLTLTLLVTERPRLSWRWFALPFVALFWPYLFWCLYSDRRGRL